MLLDNSKGKNTARAACSIRSIKRYLSVTLHSFLFMHHNIPYFYYIVWYYIAVFDDSSNGSEMTKHRLKDSSSSNNNNHLTIQYTITPFQRKFTNNSSSDGTIDSSVTNQFSWNDAIYEKSINSEATVEYNDNSNSNNSNAYNDINKYADTNSRISNNSNNNDDNKENSYQPPSLLRFFTGAGNSTNTNKKDMSSSEPQGHPLSPIITRSKDQQPLLQPLLSPRGGEDDDIEV